MKIAVSGWYFEKELFENFSKIAHDFDITVVTYKGRAEDKCPRPYDKIPASDQIKKYVLPSGVTHHLIPVAGLEFGGYDYYIKNFWDGESPVLFMHDDIRVWNHNVFYDIANEMIKDEMNQAFIFRDETEELANGRMHGRGIYCSRRFIQFMLDYECQCGQSFDHEHPHYPGQKPQVMLKGTGFHNGFWYDKYNMGEHTEGKVPYHCRHYNEGIYHFAAFAGRCNRKDPPWPGLENVRKAVYYPDFNSARRGMWAGKVYSRGKI